MGGLKKFRKSMMAAMTPNLVSSMTGNSEESKALREAIKNHLFDLPGPRYANSKPIPRTKCLVKMFRAFSEIWISLERLDDIRFLVGRFPYRGTRISGEAYLQLHVEAYLNEMYLLKGRLDKCLTVIKREYDGDGRLPEIRTHAKILSRLVHESLKNILDVRNAHTHEERFKDDGISRLGTIGLLIRDRDGEPAFVKVMRTFYRAEHAKEKRRWKETIATNGRAVRRLLDAFFDDLYPLLFDGKTKQLRFPGRLLN